MDLFGEQHRAYAKIKLLEDENERLQAELAAERELKQGWIDEYTKLRDMVEMPPNEY